jgi:HK97 family phage prohead protease
MPAMLWQHNPDEPVGVWTEMAEDETGLVVKGKLLSTGRGPQAYEALKEGALSGLSIGFVTRKSQIDDESGVRTLTDVDLWEVSLVTFPANDPARVTSVRADGDFPSEREFEQWCRRDAGLSRDEAKRVTAICFRRLLRDAEATESDPSDIAGRHVEGNREVLDALRATLGSATHGPGNEEAGR